MQYVAADRNVALEAMQMISEIAIDLPEGDRRDTLVEHAEALVEAAEELLPLKRDREHLKQQAELLKRMLEDSE